MNLVLATLLSVSVLLSGCATQVGLDPQAIDVVAAHNTGAIGQISGEEQSALVVDDGRQLAGSGYGAIETQNPPVNAEHTQRNTGGVPLGTKVAIGRAIVGVVIFVGVACSFVAC